MSPRYTEFLTKSMANEMGIKIIFIGSFFLHGITYLPAFSHEAYVDKKNNIHVFLTCYSLSFHD